MIRKLIVHLMIISHEVLIFCTDEYYKNFLVHFQDENGSKMINEYVREFKIGSGSYGKVVS